MKTRMHITVVGGGIAGLTVATAFAQKGAIVTVLEQADAIREVGAGLQISPNGLCVLRALGLEERLARQSSQGRSVSLRRAENDFEVARLDLSRLPATQRYHFVHRADLIALLFDAAQEAGVEIRLNQKVRAIEPDAPARILFDGGGVQTADLVIDAAGLHSPLRARLNEASEPFFTGQTAWRAVVPNTGQRVDDVQVHMAPRRHLVSYPIKGGALLNLVAVQERTQWRGEGWSQQDDPENLRAAFSGGSTKVMELLDRVQEVHLWGLFRHPVAQNWYGQGCAMLGDAAHPTLPFLAQGANMALEDAWALCMCVDGGDLSVELARYEALRKPRASKVIHAANGNAWRYHLPRGPVRLAAHFALGLGSRIAPSLMLKQFDWLYGYDITSLFDEN